MDKDLAEVFAMLVEAYRSTPRSERTPILALGTASSHNLLLVHAAFSNHESIYPADLDELVALGVVRAPHVRGRDRSIDITSRGMEMYEHLRRSGPTSSANIEAASRQYLDGAVSKRHPKAYAKWERSEALLWKSDGVPDFSAIGHYCREAAQEFGTSLLGYFPASDAPAEPERSKQRVAAAIRAKRLSSERLQQHADALMHYWSTVIDLAQRQEHGSQKQNDPLNWEDGRRLVAATIFSMVEIDRLLFGVHPGAT